MLPEIKLTISQDNKLIETVTRTVENQHLVKSLEEFQVEANAALTKMIEQIGDICKADGDSIDDDEDEDEDEADSLSSVNEHSKSKKKKHS